MLFKVMRAVEAGLEGEGRGSRFICVHYEVSRF